MAEHAFTYETRQTPSGKTLSRGVCSCGDHTRWQFEPDEAGTRAAWQGHVDNAENDHYDEGAGQP